MDNTIRNSAGIIIENNEGKLLLQLRDDKVKKFPNCWVLLGGALEGDETPEEAVKREIKEEIGIEIENLKYFKNFNYEYITQSFFYKKMNLDLGKIDLKEGKEIKFFSKEDIGNLSLGFNIREVIDSFLLSQNQGDKIKNAG